MMLAVLFTAAAAAAQVSRPTVYRQPKFSVTNASKVVYGQGLQCADDATGSGGGGDGGCTPMDLLLDTYSPTGAPAGTPRPAVIMMHGGGWTGGSRTDGWARASSVFYASRGFECFSITYRLQRDNGTYPGWALPDPEQEQHLEAIMYPATRDLKAAIRFVRANAERFGVDPGRVALAGGSAGAISSIAAGVADEADYKNELLATDPTLQTTNLNTSSAVQCVISHWGAGYGAELVQAADPSNRSRYSNKSSPIVEFHGDKDTTVPIADALAVEAAYRQANSSGNLAYELHVLPGDGHAAWCAGCSNADKGGKCAKGINHPDAWCHAMDTTALPFVARHLDLDLEGTPPPPGPPSPPSPPSGACTAQLAKDGCSPSLGVEACDACVGKHQSDLRAAGCTSPFVQAFCAGGGPAPTPPPPGPAHGCTATLDQLCPVEADPTTTKCEKCAETHALKLKLAGCTEQSVRKACTERD